MDSVLWSNTTLSKVINTTVSLAHP